MLSPSRPTSGKQLTWVQPSLSIAEFAMEGFSTGSAQHPIGASEDVTTVLTDPQVMTVSHLSQ